MSINQPHDPFSNNFPAPAARQTHNKGCLIAILVSLGLVMVMVILAIIGAVVALRRTGVIGNPDIPKPNSQEYEAQTYLNSLSSKLNDQPLDQEINAWVDQELVDLDESMQQHEVAFDEKMFVEAVDSSDYATSIGIAERTMVRITIAADPPWPEALPNYSVLGIKRLPDQESYEANEFATVDILFYDDDSQAFSTRWYIVKQAGQWKLYDWNRLEHGRRYSDELANYFSHMDNREADGYDEAMYQAYEAWSDYEYDEQSRQRALQKLKAAEQRQVLDADKAVRDLELVTYYELIDETEEALRLVRTIDSPKLQWGRLSQEAFLLLGLGRHKEALQVAESLLDVAPDHPNGLDAAALALYYLDRDDEARPYLLKLLHLCPAKQNSFERLLAVATEEDLATILQLSQKVPNSHGYLQSIIRHVKASTEESYAFLSHREEAKNSVPGIPASFWTCLEAAISSAPNDLGPQLESLKQIARDDSDPFQLEAEELLETHWINQKLFAEMIEFRGVTNFVEDALYDYYYEEEGPFADLAPELLAELEKNEDLNQSPLLDLVRGLFLLEKDPIASEAALDRFLVAAGSTQGIEENNEELEDDDSIDLYGADWATAMLVSLYMRSDRVLEALERFGANEATVMSVRDHFVSVPDPPRMKQALGIITKTDSGEFDKQVSEIRSAMAFAEGQEEEADKILLEAISATMQEDLPEYTIRWQVMEPIALRVRHAILDRSFERLEKWDGIQEKYREIVTKQCLSELSDQAVDRLDLDALEAANRLLNNLPRPTPETQALVYFNSLKLNQAGEQSTKAFLEVFDAALADEESYRLRYQVVEALKILIESGYIDQARLILEKVGTHDQFLDGEGDLPFKAAIAVHEGDVEAVKRHLAEYDQASVGSWLSEGYVRRLLANRPEMQDMLTELYVVQPSARSNPEGIVLLQKQSWKPQATEMRKWFEDGFPGSVQSIESTNRGERQADEETAFLVTLDSGSQLLVSAIPARIKFYGFSEVVGQRLIDQSQFVIEVSLHDSEGSYDYEQRKESQTRLWSVIQKIVNEETIALHHQSSKLLWTAPTHDLAEVANNPSLIDRQAYQDVTLSVVYDQSYDQLLQNNELTSQQLNERLQAGDSEAKLRLQIDGVFEIVDCELLENGQNDGYYRVRLKSRPVLYPDLKQGQAIDVPIYWIGIDESA